MIWTVDTDVMP